ncbi:Os10g0580100 [Oryza sativa Japonica Group]|nr:Os10g0580100 [Oryza sativa Japonica Group]
MAVVLTCSRSLSGLDPPGLASPRQGHLLVASKRYNAGGGGFMPLDGSRDWCGVFDGHAVPGVPPFSPAPLRPHPPLSLADTAAMASTPQTNRKLAVLHHAIGDGCTAADEVGVSSNKPAQEELASSMSYTYLILSCGSSSGSPMVGFA